MLPVPPLRPRDSDALRAELRRVAVEGKIPVVFGGEVHGDSLLLTEFIGTRTGLLRGLVVRVRSGLGGAALANSRPMSVADYRNASSITHDYDAPVLSEGIRTILAVPVLVDGVPRAVLYGGYRSPDPAGGRAVNVLLGSARRLGLELRVRDEVDRRLRLQEANLANRATAGFEEIREVHAELRRMAARTASVSGEQLKILADRLVSTLPEQPADAPVTLTSRELDVLAQVALGCTNREVAERLSLRPETVKSYLRSAALKLGARTRYEAVVKARRACLLP